MSSGLTDEYLEALKVLAQKRRDARDEMKNLVNAAKTTSDYCEEEEQTEEERAERGRAALYGKKRVHLGQGLSFGEMAFVKSHRRTASVVTIMDSVLIKVSILGYSQTKTFTTDRVFEVSDKVKDVLRIHPGRRNPSQISTLVHQVGMHPFFNGMSTSAISHICKNIHMHAVLAGHLIFEQGQFGSRFYIIVTGSVSFHQHQQSQDDSDLIVARNSSYVDQHKENIKELEDKADQAVGQDIKDIKDIEMSWLSPDIMEGFMLEPDVHLEVQYGSCVAVFYAGAGFGEKALTANEKRRATCIAREDTQLLVVDRTTIKSIAQLQFEENQYSRPTDVPLMLSVPPQKRQLTDLQAISDYIAALDFFKNLPPDTRINVLRQCEYSVASENQVVFFQGETADLFYIILTGTVGVHVVDARKLKPGKSVRSLLGPVRADSATTTTIVENAEQASSKFGPCIRLLYSGTHFGDAVLGVRRASAGNIHDVNSSAPPAMPKRGATIVAKERTELLTLTQLEFRVLIQQARSGMSVKTDLLIQLPHMRYLNWDVLIKISNLLQLAVLLEGAPLVTLGQEGGFLHLVRSGDCSVFMNESLINSDEISQYEAPVRERVRARGGPMHIKNSNKAQKTNIRKLLDDMEISNQKDVLVADVKVGTLSVGELYGDFELFTGTGLKPYQATVVSHKMTQVYTISNAAFVELVPSFVLEKLEESARAKHLAFKQAGLKLLNQHKNGKVADQVPLKNNDSSGVQSGGDNTPRTSHEPDALPQKPPHIPERTFLPALQNLPGIRSSAPVMGSISEIGRSNAATSNKAGDVCRLPTLLQSQTLPGRVVSGRTPRVVSGRPRVVSGRSRVASGRSVRIASGRTMHPEKVGRSRIESGRRSDTVSNIVDHRVQMIDDIMQYDPNLTISVLPAILDSTHVPCGARGLQNAVSSSRPRILDVDVCSHWGPEPLSPHEQRRWKQNTIIGR